MYHAFGVYGYTHQRTKYVGGEIHLRVTQGKRRLRCSHCGSRQVIRRGGRLRRFRALPIGRRPVWIELFVPRLECRSCGVVRQAKVSFAPGQHRYTHRLARYVLELCRHMTMLDAARHLGISWNLVKTLLKAELRRRFQRPRLKDLRLLAIDEISIGRGHQFLTVVLDLESGAVVFVGPGKGSDALDPFWKRLRASGAPIQAVATDMSQAYITAVKNHLPGATLVFDRFHVVRLMNQKLADLRQYLQRWAKARRKRALKGTRWLLLKSADHLDLRRQGLLAYYDFPITTAPLEGTNSKIKTLQRQAYGFRDHKFFKLRIYALHESRHVLVG